MSFDKMIELASKIDFDAFFNRLKLPDKILILMYLWTIHQTMKNKTMSEIMGDIDEDAIEKMGMDIVHTCELTGIDPKAFGNKITLFVFEIASITQEKQAH